MKKLFLLMFCLPALILTTDIRPVQADVAGLVPCSQSDAFERRLGNTTQRLENRLKKYEPGSAPAEAIQKQIDKTKQRFDKYKNAGLLCGADGLPHLITDGRWSHAGEFTIPGLLFLYIAGLIGWSGRSYLQAASASDNSTEKEIIIDVPLYLQSISKGFIWPLAALQELSSGKLTARADEITVSPR
uniref:Photosystem I reaction center subunit III n=1 Tax=Cyanophora biloba TaxID=1489483 RepID=A0A2Z4HGP4_9EUKA|nr:photosystem I subunit III [Cyanophora biloba]AWW13813.1 photosystem I subunit III [Cyanophora biloba]